MLKWRAQDTVTGMCNMALVQSGAKHATARSVSIREPKSDEVDFSDLAIKGITASVLLSWVTLSGGIQMPCL